MNKVVEIKVLEEKNIWVSFQDGETKIINFQPFIGKGISAPLIDPDFFRKVSIDVGGGIEWPNGFDFCPNYLKELMPNKN